MKSRKPAKLNGRGERSSRRAQRGARATQRGEVPLDRVERGGDGRRALEARALEGEARARDHALRIGEHALEEVVAAVGERQEPGHGPTIIEREMGSWLEGRVVGQTRWTERLCSLQVQAPLGPFEAGQFTRLALDVDGERIARPYSLVNAPGTEPLEFYYNVVREGPLSPRLAALEAGAPVFVAPNPAGFLVLREVPEAENLWLISTGTGLGPFLSILRTDAPWARFAHVTLVHAVRAAADCAYRDVIGAIAGARGEKFGFVPFASREAVVGAAAGRVPAAIADGRLERAAGVPLSAERSHAMLCGNPAMVTDVTAALVARGMRKHRRRAPGHISVETYW